MSRKAKRSQKAKKNPSGPKPAARTQASAPPTSAPADPPDPSAAEVEPICAGIAEWVWLVGAAVIVVGVGVWFQLDVNRVFDVPKAVILKVGGCGLFAAWLLYALFGPGVRWRSAQVFAAPVTALALAVIVSTFLSVDVATSFNGVYERQFGLQGFLACVGLFFLAATALQGKRGAWLAVGVLAATGSSIGIYALFQAYGWDPWVFFWNKPHFKVYAFLGNATFAGNALALIVPMVTVSAGIASAHGIGSEDRRHRWLPHLGLWSLGFIGVLAVQILPARAAALAALALDPVPTTPPQDVHDLFIMGLIIAPLALLTAALLGSWGPKWTRLQQRTARHQADAFAAGALSAMSVGIFLGLLFTRTRGAWVGTSVAILAAAILLPLLANGTRWKRHVQMACWGGMGVAALVAATYVLAPSTFCGPKDRGGCWIVAETIRSIPAAFDPNRTDYGKGQGTRRYLWTESPRVLVNHTATLERYYEDRADYAANVNAELIKDLEIDDLEAPTESFKAFDQAWRSAAVWFFGIGIETYRYAFMSHKSKRLEELDPMTNHDNPHNNYLYVLASFGIFGLAAYVWLLVSLLTRAFKRFVQTGPPRTERAFAFGIVASFFSYSVYSIAGFDSVACSVFLFFLLGAAAAFLSPNLGEEPENLVVKIHRQWSRFRGRTATAVSGQRIMIASVALAVLVVPLLLVSVARATVVLAAEQAFVPSRDNPSARNYYERKIERGTEAVRINPTESFYKQSLGNAYSDAARAYEEAARRDPSRAQRLLSRAAKYRAKAEQVLYAALDHAWAPENIYISLFQLYYHKGDLKAAERALERALDHSPHLGAVRANLASLQLQRNALDEALANAKWVIEVAPRNAMAFRIAGRVYQLRDRHDRARAYYEASLKRSKGRDRVAKQYLAEVERQLTSTTSR